MGTSNKSNGSNSNNVIIMIIMGIIAIIVVLRIRVWGFGCNYLQNCVQVDPA